MSGGGVIFWGLGGLQALLLVSAATRYPRSLGCDVSGPAGPALTAMRAGTGNRAPSQGPFPDDHAAEQWVCPFLVFLRPEPDVQVGVPVNRYDI